jgi:bacillithiol biosynthesis cysteine-adding enzyme BshC
VVTGQQAGLFGGPLYTLYKAITAIRLAELMEKTHHTPCVPVFWIESDDHDFKEAAGLMVADEEGELHRMALTPPAMERLPVAAYELNEEIEEIKSRVFRCLGTHAGAVRDIIEAAYRPGVSYVDAFACLLHALLPGRGLILVTPSDSALKSLALPIFQREIATAPVGSELVNEVRGRLETRGYHGQVKGRADRVNLFYHDPERRAIYKKNDQFIIDSMPSPLSRGELEDILCREPARFSPNVILRPLVQDSLFPVVAYVAGPAETAYWGEMKELHWKFEIPFPAVYPRMSITLVESKLWKILEKYGCSLENTLLTRGRAIEEKVLHHLPAGLTDEMKGFIDALESALGPVEESAARVDANLRPAFRHFSGKTRQQWEMVTKKVAAAYNQKDEVVQRHGGKLQSLLFPNGSLQERALNIVQFYGACGPDFIDRLFSEPSLSPPWNHQIMEI